MELPNTCEYCEEKYDLDSCKPIKIACKHIICLNCIHFIINSIGVMKCPFCASDPDAKNSITDHRPIYSFTPTSDHIKQLKTRLNIKK